MAKRILVTGGAGFIGSNFVQMVLRERGDWQVVSLDALTYAGNLANLAGPLQDDNFQFVKGDICDAETVNDVFKAGVDAVINFAAESHVDRSIIGSSEFISTNVMGTQVLLEAARENGAGMFVQVSTDEVYGSLGAMGMFTEETPLAPNSPYSASKAGADLLVRSYWQTHGLGAIVTRCSNNYGPWQFPEKLIPLFVTNLLAGKKVPLYGDGLNVRDWIHVADHCRALLTVLEKGKPGEVYNIGGDNERSNVEITKMVLAIMGKDDSMIEYVSDRAGHDRRYAIDASKIERQLGWRASVDFEEGLQQTVTWYVEHENWWRAIKTGEYLKYYERQYGKGL